MPALRIQNTDNKTTMTKNKILNTLTYGGYLLVAAGVVVPFFTGPQDVVYKIIFSVGAALMLTGRLLMRENDKDLRVKRLKRIQVWSALFFCVSAFFMWYSNNPKDWLVFTLAGAMIQCYVSLVLPRAQRKAYEAEERRSKKH